MNGANGALPKFGAVSKVPINGNASQKTAAKTAPSRSRGKPAPPPPAKNVRAANTR